MTDFATITAKLDCPHEVIGPCLLIQADCLKVLPMLDAGCVDAVVTNPPYGVNLGNHGGATETRPGLLVKRGGYVDTPESFDAVVVPAIQLSLTQAKRGMVFCVPPSMWKLPAPDAIGGIFVAGAVGRNRWGWSTLIHCLLYGVAPGLNLGAKPTAIKSNSTAEYTGHPTTKPLPWLLWAIALGSTPEEMVLDPFMGSGTTGVACIRTGRRFIGIELDPGYFRIACDRIRREWETYQGGPMFAPKPDLELFTPNG